jgi:hypothetical protein
MPITRSRASSADGWAAITAAREGCLISQRKRRITNLDRKIAEPVIVCSGLFAKITSQIAGLLDTARAAFAIRDLGFWTSGPATERQLRRRSPL